MTEHLLELKAAATAYYELGCNIIPIHLEPIDPTTKQPRNPDKHKSPQIKYEELYHKRQTPEEFGAIRFDDYVNGFAITCGQKLTDGRYMGVVDHDVKVAGQVTSEAIAKGDEIFKTFPTTKYEQTGSKGKHGVYFSRNPVPTDGNYHDICTMELLGEKKLCIMVPSLGYDPLNDNTPTEVEDLAALFYQKLEQAGIIVEKEKDELEEKAQQSLFDIRKIVDITKMNKIGENEYQGIHPYHESTTGKNFTVNTRDGSWYCFRHNVGGGPAQLLAVKEGIIPCPDVKKGCLKGGKYRKVLELGIAEGLINPEALQQTEINPIVLAKDFLVNYSFVVEDLSDTLYYFNGKIYSDKTKRLIKREIAKSLDENTRTRYYAEIDDYIKSVSPIKSIDENPELLAVENGVLNVLTRELKDFSPDLFITKMVHMSYNKDAKCPKIDAFKLRILPEEHKRVLAQDYEGYCLYGDNVFKKAYLANGPTDTGKTVHQNILIAALGEENLSHQTIQAINHNRFAAAELFGKMGNFIDDLPSSIVKTTGVFKMALGHGYLSGEKKNKDPFNFKSKAKIWINANALPPVAKWEDTDAYFNRLLINDYVVQIPPTEQNEKLIYELTTPEELSGWLNQALDGLERLMKNKRFSYARTQNDNRAIYTKRSDSAKWFAETHLQVTDEYDDYTFHNEIFHACVKICHAEELKNVPNSGELTKKIQENCPGAHYTKIRKVIGHDSKNNREIIKLEPAWRYLKLKSVPNVPNVRLSENSSSLQKNHQSFFVGDSVFEGSRTNGTNGTEPEKSAFKDTEKTLLIVEPSHGEPCEYVGSEQNHASEEHVEIEGKLKHYCKEHMAMVLKGYNPKLYEIKYGNVERDQSEDYPAKGEDF